MRVHPPEPEIIPPGMPEQPRAERISDEALETLATLLDDLFAIPGTRIRFGLDPLIGLVPGLGDVLTSLASLLILFAAWERGLPRVTTARMLVNIGIDSLLGAVPVLGDAFDLVWRSNRMNLALLKAAQQRRRRSQTWRDWLFLAAVAAMALAVVAAPLLLLWWAATKLVG